MIVTNNNRNFFNDIGIFAHKKLLMNALGAFLLENFDKIPKLNTILLALNAWFAVLVAKKLTN